MYTVNYHTGAGNGQTVSMRHWWDCMDGIEGVENPIRFGAYGYYGD